jgi:hypothetical protein
MIYLLILLIVTYVIGIYSVITIFQIENEIKNKSRRKSQPNTFLTKFEKEIKRFLES